MIIDELTPKDRAKLLTKTPCYVWGERILEQEIRFINNTCGKQVKICFSVKSNPWLAKWISGYVGQVEVCSCGELTICQKAGIPMEQILFGGINKNERDILYAVSLGVGTFSIESQFQVHLIQHICNQKNILCKCLLRLSSGNQFGMSEEELKEILLNKHNYPNILFTGLHFYSGTQKKKGSLIKNEIETLSQTAERLASLFAPGPLRLEYGPGIGYPYYINESLDQHHQILLEISDLIKKMGNRYDFVFEAGRICTAKSGEYITKIIDIKTNDNRKYYIVDGGTHQLNYYGQAYGHRIPYHCVIHNGYSSGTLETVTVCGSLCTSSDMLIRNLTVETCRRGDYLVFYNVGAYSSTESPVLFLSRQYPNLFFADRNNTVKQLFYAKVLV